MGHHALSIASLAMLISVGPVPSAIGGDTPATRADAPSTRAADEVVGQLIVGLEHCRPVQTGETDRSSCNISDLLTTLQTLSDLQLEQVFKQVADKAEADCGFELCLTEMVRRGGAHWADLLKAQLAAQQAADAKTTLRFLHLRQVLLLTALRRAQKRDDPLTILVAGKAKLSAKVGYLPTLNANLTNLDPDRVPVPVEVGGGYRGASRHNRWRVQVSNAKGEPLPERVEFDMGGFCHVETLEYGESEPMPLDLNAYVLIDKPGDYKVVVMCHPSEHIACDATIDGLICCRSLPLTLTVEPITIETTDAEQAKAAALVLQLPTKGTVKILGGAYTDDVAAFLSKDSPTALLKQMRWNAVPQLITFVNGDELNPTQRAWALGLLYGITGQRSPLDSPEVLGAFEYRHSGVITLSANPDGGASIGMQSISVPSGDIDERAQKDFAKGWKPWIDNGYIKVTTAPNDKQ